jgi:hypothetical protein
MGWPQITYIVLMAVGLAMTLERHGEPKKGNENFFTAVAAAAIAFWLLWCGGFFS